MRLWRRKVDPVQVLARRHLHTELTDVEGRTARFLAEPGIVRRQVLLELTREIELGEPGHRANAMATLIASIATALTLVVTLVFALFSGWMSAVIASMDPKSGNTDFGSEAEADQMFQMTLLNTVIVVVALVGLGLFVVYVAHARDRTRSVYTAWKQHFENAMQHAGHPQRNRAN